MLNSYGGCLENNQVVHFRPRGFEQFRADFEEECQPVGLLEQDLVAARWRMNRVRMPGFFALRREHPRPASSIGFDRSRRRSENQNLIKYARIQNAEKA
jgi:hypothetical protein